MPTEEADRPTPLRETPSLQDSEWISFQNINKIAKLPLHRRTQLNIMNQTGYRFIENSDRLKYFFKSCQKIKI
jgi:hypothetical protein